MSEMVERVAWALHEANWNAGHMMEDPIPPAPKEIPPVWNGLSRAAIAAMWELNEAMTNCSVWTVTGGTQSASGYLDYVAAEDLWRAMIDAALKEA